MLQVPEKLFAKASALGFECFSNARIHKILPPQETGNWTLAFQSGGWTLVINGVPQMNMSYTEVSCFLERRADAMPPSRTIECVTDSHQIRRSA
jgi:hypothetical protein